MRYRSLGDTGLQISEIGFGCGDNAGLMIGGTLDEQCRVAERAVAAGINYFDTAAGYGSEQSELSLGKVLRRLEIHPIVNTKVEITPEQAGDPAAAVVASVNASLERLQRDQVDIVMIHNSPVFHRPERWSGWMPMTLDEYLGPNGAIAGMEELRRRGRARFFGLVNERADVELARRLLDTGSFALLNVQYNLVNPTAGRPCPSGLRPALDNGAIISYAAEHGAGAAIFSPLARGVLTDAAISGDQRHSLAGTSATRDAVAYAALVSKARALSFLARDGRTLSQSAIRFILAHPGVTTVLCGFTAVEHVDEAVGALDANELNEHCILQQPYDVEVGAGTMSPETFLRVLGPQPFSVAYAQPSRRPADGRYGENPNRVFKHTQLQVILKPPPADVLEIYLQSLAAIGIDLRRHDLKFEEDNWEAPTLGAWGIGWQVMLDGLEITQFTYFQQCGGIDLDPISAEITYGLERIAGFLQDCDSIYDIVWARVPSSPGPGDTAPIRSLAVTYGQVRHLEEVQFSTYNFEYADVDKLWKHLRLYEEECHELLAEVEQAKEICRLPILPAYDLCLKCSHLFNLLDARGAISVTERVGVIARIRALAVGVAKGYARMEPDC